MIWRILWAACLRFGWTEWALSNYSDYRGFRRAVGGYWGLWQISSGPPFGTFVFWWQSSCEHYPPPVLATSTKPLESECWDSA